MHKTYQGGISAIRWLASPRDDVAPVLQYGLSPVHGGALDWFDVTTEVVTAPATGGAQASGEVREADEREVFDVWFEQYRQQTWLSAGCDDDRGPIPSVSWGLGYREMLLRGWLARAVLATAHPVADVRGEDARAINYEPVYEFAAKHRLSYNETAAMVRQVVGEPK